MAFDVLVKKNATVDDTLKLIVDAVNHCKHSPFVQKIVAELGPATDKKEFIKRLFNWICRNAKYKLDVPGIEEVWTPEKVIREGNYDCKKISVLISSVLEAAGIESILKHVYYSGHDGSLKDYTHIYVIVPDPDLKNYITVDPTNNEQLDKEVESSKQTLYYLNGKKMELHMMGKPDNQRFVPQTNFSSSIHGTACQVESEIDAICNPTSISGSNQYFSFTTGEQIAHIAKVPTLAVPRAAFLGLLYLGKLLANTPLKLNLARHIAFAWNANPNAIRKLWWSMGGEADASAIQTALRKVVGGVIYGPPQQSNDRPWIITDVNQGHYGISGTIGQGPETLAALAAATPIIAIFLKFLKDHNIIKEGQIDPTVPPGSTTIPENGIPPATPNAGSFATHSIDNFYDLLNFLKAAGVIMLGTSFRPELATPTAILLTGAFFYGFLKNKLWQ